MGVGEKAFEEETLTKTDRLNELLMTGLRTKTGVGRNAVVEIGCENDWRILLQLASTFIKSKDLTVGNDRLQATVKGWLILDHILAELFFE